jgi:hypothetical protein
MISGFLAPDGTYTPCDAYAHIATARELCEQFEDEINNLHWMPTDCFLMEYKAYIQFTIRGAFYYPKDNRDMSDAQIQFLKEHMDELDEGQKKTLSHTMQRLDYQYGRR